MLGQGGPGDFPNPLEVFNTPAGALSYYQVEMRQHRRQSCAHFHEHHNAQRDNMQLQQQLQQVQQQLQLALLTQQASAREIAQLQQQLSTAQEEKVSLQQRRNVDLEKIRTLQREKRKEAQEAAREVQVAKLRSHVPDTGSPVVSRSPRAAGPVSRRAPSSIVGKICSSASVWGVSTETRVSSV